MTFLELVSAMTTEPGARFKPTQATSVKRWLNARAAELWGMEDWTFRKVYESLSVTAGDDTPTMPATFGIALGLWDANGDPVTYIPPNAFFNRHLGNTSGGNPSSYTVVNKQIVLDPKPSGNQTWTLYHDRAYCHNIDTGVYTPGDMDEDTDLPALPTETHYLLIHGAISLGSVAMNDFTYQFAEQAWQTGVESMKRNFLVDQRGEVQQWGALSDDAVNWS